MSWGRRNGPLVWGSSSAPSVAGQSGAVPAANAQTFGRYFDHRRIIHGDIVVGFIDVDKQGTFARVHFVADDPEVVPIVPGCFGRLNVRPLHFDSVQRGGVIRGNMVGGQVGPIFIEN